MLSGYCTNILPYGLVFAAYRAKGFELAVSTEILREYGEIFGQQMTPLIADNLLELIGKQANTIKNEIYYRWGVSPKIMMTMDSWIVLDKVLSK